MHKSCKFYNTIIFAFLLKPHVTHDSQIYIAFQDGETLIDGA
jgi:hypothetical protein